MRDLYLSFVSVVSVVIAVVLTPPATRGVIHVAGAFVGRKLDLPATPAGNAVLLALVFVVVWCVVSFFLIVPRLFANSRRWPRERRKPPQSNNSE